MHPPLGTHRHATPATGTVLVIRSSFTPLHARPVLENRVEAKVVSFGLLEPAGRICARIRTSQRLASVPASLVRKAA